MPSQRRRIPQTVPIVPVVAAFGVNSANVRRFFAVQMLLANRVKLQYHNTRTAKTLGPTGKAPPYAGTDSVMHASRGWVMDKKLCIGSLAVAGVMLLLFLLDLLLGFPFGGGAFAAIDFLGILASGILIYIAISALRDVR